MCGRYSIVSNFEAVRRLFGVNPNIPNWWVPRSNVAPAQDAPIVRLHDGERELVQLRWGLIPYWAKDAKIGYSTINARSETVAIGASFREAFSRSGQVVSQGCRSGFRCRPIQPRSHVR